MRQYIKVLFRCFHELGCYIVTYHQQYHADNILASPAQLPPSLPESVVEVDWGQIDSSARESLDEVISLTTVLVEQ